MALCPTCATWAGVIAERVDGHHPGCPERPARPAAAVEPGNWSDPAVLDAKFAQMMARHYSQHYLLMDQPRAPVTVSRNWLWVFWRRAADLVRPARPKVGTKFAYAGYVSFADHLSADGDQLSVSYERLREVFGAAVAMRLGEVGVAPHPSHDWKDPDAGQTVCTTCGAYRHLSSGLRPCDLEPDVPRACDAGPKDAAAVLNAAQQALQSCVNLARAELGHPPIPAGTGVAAQPPGRGLKHSLAELIVCVSSATSAAARLAAAYPDEADAVVIARDLRKALRIIDGGA